MHSSRRLRWLGWGLAAVAGIVVLVVGGAFIYIHLIEAPAPAPLSVKDVPATTSTAGSGRSHGQAAATGPVAGTWRVAAGSVVGYRVQEVLVGQNNTAVGRTSQITGNLTISGDAVTAASFTVQMATIHSDQSQRDAQFDGRIMDVAAYPTGVFTLTGPISLGSLPATGAVKTYTATGNLALHGHSRPVTFTLAADRTANGKIEVSGSIPIVFARWGIANPSFGSFVTTQNHGVLEFLLVLNRA